MALYKLTQDQSIVQRTSDGAFIPNDPSNSDFKAYQGWLALGNAPDPLPVIVPLTPQQIATALLQGTDYNAILWRGLIGALATQLGKTPVQIFNAIVNAAN